MSPLTGESIQLCETETKMKSEKIIYNGNANVWAQHDSQLECNNIEDNLKAQHCNHADCIKEFKPSSSQKLGDGFPDSKVQDQTGGARPKTTSVHGNKKSVRWAEDLAATVEVQEVTVEDEETKQISNLLNCLREQRTFFKSPAFEAVSWMYDRDENMTLKSELAYILLRLKHDREPTVREMMGVIDSEPEMDAHDLVGAIVDECEGQGGASFLESFLLKNNISEKQKCLHRDHLQEELNTEDEVEKKAFEIPKLTKEEQSQILKVEALKIEQTFLKNSLSCRQCKERPVNTTFLPCGHVVLCSECSESCYTCPLCKQQVLGEVKTYLC
ncbi:unnamed protein product [Lymnaea stagnalis]|uniref:RING-type domain-containing protein n=1 Tax=Lymnaea stagnalis TaxID=6523 RepID=A0AAV2IHS3_LYMST